VDFDFKRELGQRGRRRGRRVESDEADLAKLGVGTELGLGGVPRAGQVVIVRSADQLDEGDQGGREDRCYRPVSGFYNFAWADQNRSRRSLPINIRNPIAVQEEFPQVGSTDRPQVRLDAMKCRSLNRLPRVQND